jgi:hypothetical protein
VADTGATSEGSPGLPDRINPSSRFGLSRSGNVLISGRQGRRRAAAIKNTMTIASQVSAAHEAVADHEQKRLALGYLQEAWVHARHDGIDGDCLAQTALFLALAELVSTYGEEATAHYAERLAGRIHNGEFSVEISRQ